MTVVRRVASCCVCPDRSDRTCFQRANRKAGRPQAGVKCVIPSVWECLLIYGLFAVMPTILNLKRNKFCRVMKPVEAYKVVHKWSLIFFFFLSLFSRDGNREKVKAILRTSSNNRITLLTQCKY